MAEFIRGPVQTVAAGGNVLFDLTPVCGGPSVVHRAGSGVVSLRGMTCDCFARYKVSFGGNIAVPVDGTVGPVSLAIALEGEGLDGATMIQTPAAVGAFANVFAAVFIDVPRGCCATVGVKNTGTAAVDVQNANLIVERVA